MKSKQIWLISGLILTLLVSAAGLSGAGILDNASQIVNLAASGTGTVVPLNTVARVTPDGGIIPFDPGSNVVVVINKIMWKFKPDNPQITNPVQLRLTAIPFSPPAFPFIIKSPVWAVMGLPLRMTTLLRESRLRSRMPQNGGFS